MKRPEEKAFEAGFRVTKEGKLYNLNGRVYKTDLSTGKERFYLRREKRTQTIYIDRLQAYIKYGEELFKFYRIRHLNSDNLDCSYDNIVLGAGSEIITPELEKMHKTKRAFHLGYRVDKLGNLLLNGVVVNDRIFCNKFGYKLFSIPFKVKRQESVFVHRLQALIKFGEEEFYKAECVRHLDGNCVNNSWKNIQIGTFKENSNDISSAYKKQYYLERSPKIIKYPIPFRNKLRKEFKEGERVWDLHIKYEIPYSVVRYIIQRSLV